MKVSLDESYDHVRHNRYHQIGKNSNLWKTKKHTNIKIEGRKGPCGYGG